MFIRLLVTLLIVCLGFPAFAQEVKQEDTTQKKTIFHRLGKTLYRKDSAEAAPPPNPYKDLIGKTIRSITVKPYNFNVNIYDTTQVKNSQLVRIMSAFHRTTLEKTIFKNLFFHVGDQLLPLQLVDNERFLRDLSFIQDANIIVKIAPGAKDSVDVFVLTRDVISLSGSGAATNKRARGLVMEDNLFGTGHRIAVVGIIDKDRSPLMGWGGEALIRNIKGKFSNISGGVTSFGRALNSGFFQEKFGYFRFDKPMITRYTTWTGAIQVDQHETRNNYSTDSLYNTDIRYKYYNIDGWWGYNIGGRDRMYSDNLNRLRHIVAIRGLYTHFYDIPDIAKIKYDYRYANVNGGLLSYSLYRLNFYKSNFVYGFGRTEDIPKGVTATFTTGLITRQNVRRTYYGLSLQMSDFNVNSGRFIDYTFKTSGYVGQEKWQDINILGQVNMFTQLKEFKNPHWLNRNFFTASAARQFNHKLDAPLFIRTDYGLPYFLDYRKELDTRLTIRGESVFYYLRNFAGFKFAPFIFSDMIAVHGKGDDYTLKGYPVFGSGLRVRNESLVFGTMEARLYYMPQTINNANNFKGKMQAQLRFKYNTRFARQPDFVDPNNYF